MPGEAIAASAPLVRPRFELSFADSAFVLFLLLVFVSLQPFATRVPAVPAAGGAGFGGAGDTVRQLAYLSALALVGVAAFEKSGLRGIFSVSGSLALLLAWCASSALWATAPDVVL